MPRRHFASHSARTARVAAAGLFLAALTAVPTGGAASAAAQAAPRPEVDVYDTTVNESILSPTAVLTVRLARKAKKRVTVRWRTVDGTAIAESDYVADRGAVVFAPGERSKRVGIVVLDDGRPEQQEFFSVVFSSRQATVTRKRVAVSIIDDDVAPYGGEVVVSSRWEQEANGFYTLETWTLTMRPRLVPSNAGTAWYDDALGQWRLTGSRVLEDHRPHADCRVVEEETWSGQGDFFTEPHPDVDVTGPTGIVVLEAFFPQHAGNLGLDPKLHAVVSGHADGTQYSFEDGACVPYPYENEERFALDEAVGEVVKDGRGRVAVFDQHQTDDRSTEEELDLYQLDVVGELWPMVE